MGWGGGVTSRMGGQEGGIGGWGGGGVTSRMGGQEGGIGGWGEWGLRWVDRREE